MADVDTTRDGPPLAIEMIATGSVGSGGGTWWTAIEGPPAFWRLRDVPLDEAVGAAASPAAVGWMGEQLNPGDLLAPAAAGAVLAVFQEPVPGHEDEWNRWMDEEHLPALSGVPGVLAGRRYRALVGHPGFVGVYHLEDPEVCRSEVWRTASDTPWRARMRDRAHHRSRHLLVPAGDA